MDFTERWGATEDCLVREAGSLGELLEQLRGRIPRVLIGDREWARLSERAHQLPVTMAAFPFGFELPPARIPTGSGFRRLDRWRQPFGQVFRGTGAR